MAHDREDTMKPLIEAIVDSTWQRLRSLVLTALRYENFVTLPPEQNMPSPADSGGTMHRPDRQEIDELAQHLLAMNLAAVLDLHALALLEALAGTENGMRPEALAAASRQPELAVRERLASLHQAGWVRRDYDSASYQLTPAGREVLSFLLRCRKALGDRIDAELSGMLQNREENA